jgi:translation initiation factor IF-2
MTSSAIQAAQWLQPRHPSGPPTPNPAPASAPVTHAVTAPPRRAWRAAFPRFGPAGPRGGPAAPGPSRLPGWYVGQFLPGAAWRSHARACRRWPRCPGLPPGVPPRLGARKNGGDLPTWHAVPGQRGPQAGSSAAFSTRCRQRIARGAGPAAALRVVPRRSPGTRKLSMPARHRHRRPSRDRRAGGFRRRASVPAGPPDRRPRHPGCVAGRPGTLGARRRHAASQRPERGPGCRPRQALPGLHTARRSERFHTPRWACVSDHPARPAR